MNALSLCYKCHANYTSNPLDFNRFCEKHLGRTHLDILNEKRRFKLKTTKALRSEIAKHYREQFESMEEGGEFESWI